jgi:hypothetical protein
MATISASSSAPGEQIRVRADGHNRCARHDVLLQQIERRAGPCWHWVDRLRPVARASPHVDVNRSSPVSELQDVGNAAGALAAAVQVRSNADHLDLRPAEQQGERARVVGIAAEVGIEMDAQRQ